MTKKLKTKPLDQESWSDHFTLKVILTLLCAGAGALAVLSFFGVI